MIECPVCDASVEEVSERGWCAECEAEVLRRAEVGLLAEEIAGKVETPKQKRKENIDSKTVRAHESWSRERTKERVRKHRSKRKAANKLDRSSALHNAAGRAKAKERKKRKEGVIGEKVEGSPQVAEDEGYNIAKAELAARALCRVKLLPFIIRMKEGYKPGWVHKDICLRLEKFVHQVEKGESPRLMIQMPPRHGKTEVASMNLPGWILGRNPHFEIIACSYAASLAMEFSRYVRGMMADKAYRTVFPTRVDPDNRNAEGWKTTRRGMFLPAGVGGGITGKGAHVLIIDDPVKNAEEAESQVSRDSAKNWYRTTAYTRLAPGGGVLIIQCMVGDTPVLRPDGSYTRLDEIRPGDRVASYDKGRLVSARVKNWASQGQDDVLVMTMTSGIIVRANERHPFLVEDDTGERKWIRLGNLKSGQRIVTVRGSGGSGKGKSAVPKGAVSRSRAVDCVHRTTTNGNGTQGIVHRLRSPLDSANHILKTGMGLLSRSIRNCLKASTGIARFADYPRIRLMRLRAGTSGCALTMTPEAGLFEGCSATTATYSSSGETQSVSLNRPCDTDDFTTDTIASIVPGGREEVFDIEVEGTHNFVSVFLVASNTRWHDDDLSGWLETIGDEGEGDVWDIARYPAEAIVDEAYRDKGEALHEERWPHSALMRIKNAVGPRTWASLYQQNPVPDDGEYFQKDMFGVYKSLPTMDKMAVYVAWDLAIGQKEQNDYTCGIVVGLTSDEQVFVLDRRYGRWDAYRIVEEVLSVQRTWGCEAQGIERGQLSMAIAPHLNRRIREEGMWELHVKELPPGKRDKVARARAIQGRMKQKMVSFPLDSEWGMELQREMLRFPNGVHDDQVDAMAYIGLMLQDMTPPTAKGVTPKDQRGWRARLFHPRGRTAMSA